MQNGNRKINGSRQYGIVREYSTVRGMGIIDLDNGGGQALVRYSWIGGSGVRSLTAGQRVSFELEQDEYGVNAVRVEGA